MSNFDTSWYCPTCESFVCANGDRRCGSCGNQVTTLSTIQAAIDERERRLRDLGSSDTAPEKDFVDEVVNVAVDAYHHMRQGEAMISKEEERGMNQPKTNKIHKTNRGKYSLDPPKEDNWIHRSQGMRCNTCMYYVPKPTEQYDTNQSTLVGRCRRYAPSLSGFPVVYVDDWCGDHKLDEEKA